MEQEIEREKLLNEHFRQNWSATGEFPACDEGMVLLRKFAEMSPALYELAERVQFIDPAHGGFKTNPFWLAFAAHRSACEKCNEI